MSDTAVGKPAGISADVKAHIDTTNRKFEAAVAA